MIETSSLPTSYKPPQRYGPKFRITSAIFLAFTTRFAPPDTINRMLSKTFPLVTAIVLFSACNSARRGEVQSPSEAADHRSAYLRLVSTEPHRPRAAMHNPLHRLSADPCEPWRKLPSVAE